MGKRPSYNTNFSSDCCSATRIVSNSAVTARQSQFRM